MKALFYDFDQQLTDQGYGAQKGQIVDASVVDVPKQRNIREENKQIKEGKTPEKFSENPKVGPQKIRILAGQWWPGLLFGMEKFGSEFMVLLNIGLVSWMPHSGQMLQSIFNVACKTLSQQMSGIEELQLLLLE